jgi:hypothetical protein
MSLFRRPFARKITSLDATRLRLETLEDRTVPSSARVVPLSLGVDNSTTFHRLQDALAVATTGGDVVTIEPGATADLGPVTVSTNGITITGDPNTPGSILPSYDIVVNASRVSLTRLNLGSVTINPDFTGDSITRSTVNTIGVTGGQTSLGNVFIDHNTITGSVSVSGMVSAPILNVTITNNTFNTFVPASRAPLVNIQDATNAVVANNTIDGGGGQDQIGIQVTRGLNTLIANNAINLSAGDLGGEGIVLQNPGFSPLTTATVRNNTVVTRQGRGLYVNAFNDFDMQAVVQGNDFHSNAVGVEYLGSASGTISTDLGGGMLGSLGGNNFRGIAKQGTAGNAAIVMRNVGPGGVLTARYNIFDNPATAAAAVVVAQGSGSIDVSQPLSTQRSFAQILYNDMLGRTGTLGELDFWVSVLNAGGANGEANVINGILRSDESLGRVVDRLYSQYLDRTADQSGHLYWVSQLKAGMTLEQVEAGFVSSAEFVADNNSDSIQALYRNLLGRTASQSELAYWYGKLPSLGLGGVALDISKSGENRNDLLTRVFLDFLHRSPSAGDLTYWAAQPGDTLTVEVKLLASGEFNVRG